MIIFGHKKLQFEKFQKAVDSLFVPPPQKTPLSHHLGYIMVGVHVFTGVLLYNLCTPITPTSMGYN